MISSWQDAAEVTDYEPARSVRVKKMTWSDQDRAFRTHHFLRVTCRTTAEFGEMMDWCEQQFGRSCYHSTWWIDPVTPQIWLADDLATFWQQEYGTPP